MPFNNPDRSREEIEFFTQAIFQMSQKRKMQAGFATRCKHNKRGRAHSNLGQVLHVQPGTPMGLCRRDS
jgi:hypothetical protein